MRSHHAQLDFDLDLARTQSPENPVYYIQYAHARICSIFRKATEQGIKETDIGQADLSLLTLPEEITLAKQMGRFPSVIEQCTSLLEPHHLAFYLLELARHFQTYYSQAKKDARYRVLDAPRDQRLAKLVLLKNLRFVLHQGLGLLGISAPETMSRREEDDV